MNASTPRPGVVAKRGGLPDLPTQLRRLQRRRNRRPRAAVAPDRLPRRSRDRRHLAQPVLPVATRRRWLRHHRLSRRRPTTGHPRRLRRADSTSPRPRHQDHRRHRPQPHLGPAPLVPSGPGRRPRLHRPRPVHLSRRHRTRRRATPRTGGPTSVAAPGSGSPTGSGTATSSPANNPTSTGATRTSATTSSTPSGSGPTAASTDSASTSPTRSAKDLTDPLRSQAHLDQRLPLDGTDPLYDREEVHNIYRSGGRSSTSTTHPGWRSPKPGTPPTAAPTSTPGRRTRPGLRLLAAQIALGPRAVPPRHPAVHSTTTGQPVVA